MANKYGARRTEVDGVVFASKREAARYRELTLMLAGGVITELELQPQYELVVNGYKIGTYRPDFRYWDVEQQRRVVEEVKPPTARARSRDYVLRKKLVKALHFVDVVEV